MLTEQKFWQYACDLYASSGVTDVCLNLQDTLGLNVNLLLLLCWAEKQQQQLSGAQIEALVQSVNRWHQNYTRPLRQLRRRLALDDVAQTDAKQALFEAELTLEKTEQRLLLATYNQFQFEQVSQAQNLQRYIGNASSKAVLDHAEGIALLRSHI